MDARRASPGDFGERVGGYDRAYDRFSADGYALRSRMTAVVALVGDGPGELLDVGMGAGRLCEQLGGRGWTVSGIDALLEMVEAPCDRLPDVSERLHVGQIELQPGGQPVARLGERLEREARATRKRFGTRIDYEAARPGAGTENG